LKTTNTIIIIFLFLTNAFGQTKDSTNNESLKIELDKLDGELQFGKYYRPLGIVSDYEGIFTSTEVYTLDSLVRQFKKETGITIAIITLDSLSTSKEKFDEFSLSIANLWGVGDKERDDGILIALSAGLRKLRINNGVGIEKILANNETAEIINKHFIPYFKKKQLFEGTYIGTTELINFIKTKIK
jgi:uncharacterized protein